MGRCKATNLCAYCARLAAVENAEVLAQDAMSNSAPSLWTVLTTASTVAEMAAYKHAREATRRAVKRVWPHAECATLIEFTTGMGTRAGGDRRPHWNDVWKGIPTADADRLGAVTAGAWCERIDARPEGQYVGSIDETGGLMRYLALHFQKENQQPPAGWRGHRFTTTRGYLAEPMAAARERARQALRLRRELWKLDQLGLGGEEALECAERRVYEASELAWSLVRLQPMPTAFGPDGLPSAWVDVVTEVRS